MQLLKGGVRLPIKFEMLTEAGELFKVKFNVVFKRFTSSLKNERSKESRKLSKQIKKELARIEEAGLTDENISDADQVKLEGLLKKLEDLPIKWMKSDILNWDGLRDMDESEVEYSKTELNELLDHRPFIDGFNQAWSKAHGGLSPEAESEADSKN